MKDTKPAKMHVAMIGHKRVPSREGGVEVVVWELAKRLRDRGLEVDCYNRSYHMNPGIYEKIEGKPGVYSDRIRIITVPTVRNGKLNAIVYSFFASIRVLFTHYDVIHYHAEGPCLMLWLPKLFGRRVIATVHGLDWQRAKWGHFASGMLKLGEKMAAKHADGIIVLSRNVQDYFRQTYGRETHFIPNGIDPPTYRTPGEITKRWGLQGDDYIMTLCRIVPEKGLHYIIEAWKKLYAENPELPRKKLLIVGGSSNAKEYTEKIEAMAADSPDILLTGFAEGDTLAELLSNCFCYCLPSDVEGMSISLLEAMSYGNCCVVSDIRENTEVVSDRAVTFRKSDVDDLKEKLKMLLLDPDLVWKYRNMSSDYILKNYNWDEMTNQTLALYEKK